MNFALVCQNSKGEKNHGPAYFNQGPEFTEDPYWKVGKRF